MLQNVSSKCYLKNFRFYKIFCLTILLSDPFTLYNSQLGLLLTPISLIICWYRRDIFWSCISVWTVPNTWMQEFFLTSKRLTFKSIVMASTQTSFFYVPKKLLFGLLKKSRSHKKYACSSTANFIKKASSVYTHLMSTIYLSLSTQVAKSTFFMNPGYNRKQG